MSTTDRYEHDNVHNKSRVIYRSVKDREYIDLEMIILCPACPVEKDQEDLTIAWDGKDYTATCPGCGYTAVIDVQEGVRQRRSL
jgi:hypothetical protein